MNWSDAMKDNADLLARDHSFTNASDMQRAESTSWDPHEVWLTRIKQPRDRAAGRAMAAAARQAGNRQD
jgi:hypothetical protein